MILICFKRMIIDEQFAMIGDGIALIGGTDDTDDVPPKRH